MLSAKNADYNTLTLSFMDGASAAVGLCNLELVVSPQGKTELFGQVVCLCFLYVAVWTSCLSLFSLRGCLDKLSVFKFGQVVCLCFLH